MLRNPLDSVLKIKLLLIRFILNVFWLPSNLNLVDALFCVLTLSVEVTKFHLVKFLIMGKFHEHLGMEFFNSLIIQC